jgi:hypothetical protein
MLIISETKTFPSPLMAKACHTKPANSRETLPETLQEKRCKNIGLTTLAHGLQKNIMPSSRRRTQGAEVLIVDFGFFYFFPRPHNEDNTDAVPFKRFKITL